MRRVCYTPYLKQRSCQSASCRTIEFEQAVEQRVTVGIRRARVFGGGTGQRGVWPQARRATACYHAAVSGGRLRWGDRPRDGAISHRGVWRPPQLRSSWYVAKERDEKCEPNRARVPHSVESLQVEAAHHAPEALAVDAEQPSRLGSHAVGHVQRQADVVSYCHPERGEHFPSGLCRTAEDVGW